LHVHAPRLSRDPASLGPSTKARAFP
jgi:hypothetical protein